MRATTMALAALLGCLAVASIARGAPISRPQDGSDLKPDPAITFGALDNGMRYEIQRNTYPAGRVSFRFRVDVGSRVEQGINHRHQDGLSSDLLALQSGMESKSGRSLGVAGGTLLLH
jgi:hypothetical protein